jgi:hypothetical protein
MTIKQFREVVLNHEGNLPYSDMYLYAVSEMERVTIHSRGILPNVVLSYTDGSGTTRELRQWTAENERYDKYFDKNIFNRYLTMNPQRLKWSKLIYQPAGQVLVMNAANRYNAAIFQAGSYEFSSTHEPTETYINGANFNNQSFDSWVSERLLIHILEDPNGCLVVLRGDEINATQPAKPYIKYVSSDRILHRPTDTEPFLAFCDNGITAQTNTVFVVDKFGTTEHLRTDGKAYIVKEYPNYGFEPYVICGGNIVTANVVQGVGYTQQARIDSYYCSYISFICSELDSLCRETIHYEGDRKDVIPMRGIIARNCEKCNGTGEIIGDCGDDTRLGEPECAATCKTCGGHGHIISINQGDTLEVNEDVLAKVGGNINGAINWFNPDTNIVKMSTEIVDTLNNKIAKKLYVYQAEGAAQQTAEAKKIDLQAAAMFIGKLANRCFYVADVLLKSIASYLQMNAEPDYKVTPTANYQLKDEQDLQAEILGYKQAGLPQLADNSERELLMKNGNYIGIKQMDYWAIYSPFENYSDVQILGIRNVFGNTPAVESGLKMKYFGQQAINTVLYNFGESWFLATDLTTLNAEVQKELAKINVTTNATIQPF